MRRVSLTYKNVDEFIVIVIIKMRLSRRLSIFLVVEIFKRNRINDTEYCRFTKRFVRFCIVQRHRLQRLRSSQLTVYRIDVEN